MAYPQNHTSRFNIKGKPNYVLTYIRYLLGDFTHNKVHMEGIQK